MNEELTRKLFSLLRKMEKALSAGREGIRKDEKRRMLEKREARRLAMLERRRIDRAKKALKKP